MYNYFVKFILLLLLTLTVYSTQAQNNYSFNNDRSIKIPNSVKGNKQVTLYLKVQSTSTSQYDGHGTYSRLLGASGFFIELADTKGKLAFYNGSKWRTTSLNIREEKKDIFVIFDEGNIKIMDGTKLIGEKTHRRKTFDCAELFLGSNFRASERFIGEMDHFIIYNRKLSPEDMADIISGKSKKIKKTEPVQYYNFEKGIVYQYGMKASSQKLDVNIGKRHYRSSVPNEIVEEAPAVETPRYKRKKKIKKKEQVIADELPPEPYLPAKNNPFDLNINFHKIDTNNHEYEGVIKNKQSVLKPGSYDLIIKPDGKIIIQEKTAVEKY